MQTLLSCLCLLTPALPAAQASAPEPALVGTRLLDLDGDGALDLLALHGDGTLVVRRNVAPRRFVEVPQELPRVAVSEVLCSDLDGDGRPDLYLVSPGPDVALLGEGAGRFRVATQELGLIESGPGLSAERLDVDGDGLLDLVLHNQGSDVLFWARPDGRFERELGTSDVGLPRPEVEIAVRGEPAPPVARGDLDPEKSKDHAGAAAGLPAPLAPSSGPSSASTAVASLLPPSSSAPAMAIGLDARYVNDNMNEVDSADILDGSLTGADVSTSGGNVTFGGGSTVTARQGLFGTNASVSNPFATVSGGDSNSASGLVATVSGGSANIASGGWATVSGGLDNSASGFAATVSGGDSNVASGEGATVSGGLGNDASGDWATVSGGRSNGATGNYSFAAGRDAEASHNGAFVWADSVPVGKPSSADDQFNVYAEGGTRIFAVGQATPSLVVAPDGKVGIGTGSPASLVTIDGSGSTTDQLSYLQPGSSAGSLAISSPGGEPGFLVGTNDGLSTHAIKFENGGIGIDPQGGTPELYVANGGKVGIGTTAPLKKLHVRSGSSGTSPTPNASLAVESSSEASISLVAPDNQEASVFFGNPSAGANAGAIVYNPFGGALPNGLALRTNDTNRLEILADGRIDFSADAGTRQSHINHGANGDWYIRSASASGNVYLQDNGGNVGIGTSSPAFKLEVNGSAHRVDNSSTWTVTSDERLKKDIEPLHGSLATLLSLRGVQFEYKDPELAGLHRGFIAQEVEKILPEWVEDGPDGYKRLTINGFEALAVEALRELEARCGERAARIAELEARVARLESLEDAFAALRAELAR